MILSIWNDDKNKFSREFAKWVIGNGFCPSDGDYVIVLDDKTHRTCNILMAHGIPKKNILVVEVDKSTQQAHSIFGVPCHKGDLASFVNDEK